MQTRASYHGLKVGSLPAGPRNQITDVPGVTVGHCTVDTDTHKTGVTVLFPCAENPFVHKLPAAAFVLNGYGKSAGLVQIQELGTLESPIALTNTLNVGKVHDALVGYLVERCEAEGVELRSVNPVVCECNDSTLNDICHRAVEESHVRAAMEQAGADFDEGDVGAGKGMVCHDLKGGIGSASRLMEVDGKTYTLDPTTGGYIESPSATAGMDYQQLMTLGQAEMVQLYIDGATAAEDFAFTEEENGLRVSFTMPTEQLGQMQQQISSLMTDELLPALEEQMRQSVSEQMDALLESMGGAEALQVDQAQLDALIDQQVQMVMEMERQLFESLQINGLSCDMLITDGVINDQTVGMQMEFALRDLVDSLAGSLGVTGTDTSTVPESCGLDMQIHAVIADRNQEIEIDFPDFDAAA